MDLFEALAKRHSYRGPFTGDAIPRERLREIVQAGLQAPSGCNAQTPTFVIVDDPALIARMADITGNKMVRAAAAAIVCVAEHKPVYRDMSFAVEDCAAAVENMLLAVTALGLATVWLDGALRVENRAGRIAELLRIPPGREVRIVLPLGKPAEQWAPKEKLPFEKRAAFNQWPAA